MPTAASIIAAIITGAGLAWISIPHCFGMCGALHLTVSCLHSERPIRALSIFNLGRLLGYTILGTIAGGAGFLINKAGVSCCGNATSPPIFSALIPAICFLAIAIGSLRNRGVTGGKVTPLFRKLLGRIGLFTSGCAASLLPCSVLYVALAAAVGTGQVIAGGILMFVYCLMITVVMQLVLTLGHGVHHAYKSWLEKFVPYIFVVLAVFYFALFFAKL
jgi:sulfite exporter TauE/SafE